MLTAAVAPILLGQAEAVVVDVGDDDAAGARIAADARGDNADRAGADDQHILADEVEHQRRVGGVAEGVKEGDDVLGQILGDGDDVGGRDAQILGKGAVAVHADAAGVLAPLDVAAVAVAAAAAGDVALAGDALTDREAGDALAQRGDLAHIFMADGHRGLDVQLRPGVPVEDVHVRAADGGLVDLDEHLARMHGLGTGTRRSSRPLPATGLTSASMSFSIS
jgi:hypothetical protein